MTACSAACSEEGEEGQPRRVWVGCWKAGGLHGERIEGRVESLPGLFIACGNKGGGVVSHQMLQKVRALVGYYILVVGRFRGIRCNL